MTNRTLLISASALIFGLTLSIMNSTCQAVDHGKLRVTDNHRYLQYEDGTPFFYLGDTAWELFHRLNREEAVRYLTNRAEKGFTVIQAVVLAEMGGFASIVPNPFNPSTSIRFVLPRDSQTHLSVYNTQGRLVKTLVNEFLPAQEHAYTWNGVDAYGQRVASGIYFCHLEGGGVHRTIKMVLLK